MPKTNIQIHYTKFLEQLPDNLFNEYLSLLPAHLQKKNSKLFRWQDRHANLFGKLLLQKGLRYYGYADDILQEIQLNIYSRPFLKGAIDFNISHSGGYVLCAVGKDLRLGVDVEEIKDINFDDFNQIMTCDQWQDIMISKDAKGSFFKYWTIKESVIKADSRGLSIPLSDIHVYDNKVFYDNQTWYLQELKLDKDYRAFLATNRQTVEFDLEYADFSK